MKAVELLNGQHNFSAFTTRQGREAMIKAKKNPIKNVKIGIFFISNQTSFCLKIKTVLLKKTRGFHA
jgi:tRNA U38,U39,U40 pseudouridine synthase TruA